MIFFNQCDVSVNGTGILAENASVSVENGVSPNLALGRLGSFEQGVNGPLKTTFQFSYTLDLSAEPNYPHVSGLKNAINSYDSVLLSVGGLSGRCLLESFSFRTVPNDIIRANVSYVSFTPISGDLTAKVKNLHYADVQVTGQPITGDRLRVNGGTHVSGVAGWADNPGEWLIDTMSIATIGLWSYKETGFHGTVDTWSAPNTNVEQIDSGVRFKSTVGSFPSVTTSGSWAKVTTGFLYPVEYNKTRSSGLAHGWAVSLQDGVGIKDRVVEFDYNFRANWDPIYALGSKYPVQTQFIGAEEDFSMTKYQYREIPFSGESSSIFFGNATKVILGSISSLYYEAPATSTIPNPEFQKPQLVYFLEIPIDGGKVNQSTVTTDLDDAIRVNSSFTVTY